MPIDIFSKRQKILRGEVPDIYEYDNIPNPLRIQIVHIMNDALGDKKHPKTKEIYKGIHQTLCREYGKFFLVDKPFFENDNYHVEDVIKFILSTSNTEEVLDVVELSFSLIDFFNKEDEEIDHAKITPDEAIKELNARFKEHGVGYQFESGKIIRVDSQIIHNDAVKPVLHLLSDERFKGANEEFLQAHEHYRHKRYKECLNDCLKALESTMKTICDHQGWKYDSRDAAKNLIGICFQNHLIPTYLETQFSTLRQNIESGIPTVRNKLGGHGQGSQQITVPEYFASYQLNMTASTILLLVEAENSLIN
jgi:predicted house-cleaning noncanonical NTP pyrophosphatase (MazG superfamily)